MNKAKNKSRTLINLIGLPSILFIVYQGGLIFKLFLCLVMFLAIIEFSELMNIKGYSINKLFLFSFIPVFISDIYLLLFSIYHITNTSLIIVYALILFIWEIFRSKNTPLENIALTIFGSVWIIYNLHLFNCIREYHFHGLTLTLLMLLSVWSCDSAAFYFGSKFGKKKILPLVSPNKTWIGTIAGFLSAILIAYIFGYLFPQLNLKYYDILIFGTIIGIVGQIGDFFESMIKRELNVKDSGTILQGHGGVLDRFDSLFFVIPLFYLYLLFRFPSF